MSNTLGQRIHDVRVSRGISSEHLAELCDLSSGSYVRLIERGKKNPSVSLLITICKALKISSDYILGDELNNTESIDAEKSIIEKLKLLSPSQMEFVDAMIDKFIEQSLKRS